MYEEGVKWIHCVGLLSKVQASTKTQAWSPRLWTDLRLNCLRASLSRKDAQCVGEKNVQWLKKGRAELFKFCHYFGRCLLTYSDVHWTHFSESLFVGPIHEPISVSLTIQWAQVYRAQSPANTHVQNHAEHRQRNAFCGGQGRHPHANYRLTGERCSHHSRTQKMHQANMVNTLKGKVEGARRWWKWGPDPT